MFGFEFTMFKHDENNQIDGTDFARSIIKYVDSSKKNKYMNRIAKFIEDFDNLKIEKESYIGFHYYIQTNLHVLEK